MACIRTLMPRSPSTMPPTAVAAPSLAFTCFVTANGKKRLRAALFAAEVRHSPCRSILAAPKVWLSRSTMPIAETSSTTPIGSTPGSLNKLRRAAELGSRPIVHRHNLSQSHPYDLVRLVHKFFEPPNVVNHFHECPLGAVG